MLRILVVLLICSVSVAQAEVIQFEMTGLTGDIDDWLNVDSLYYDGPGAVVNSVSIRVAGAVTDLGLICCSDTQTCPDDAYAWIVGWWGSVEHIDDPDPVHGKWVAGQTEILSIITSFDQTDVAENQNSFNSISAGDVFIVELYFGPYGWIGDCEMVQPPAGTKYTVTVLMDVSYPLPTQPTTWGQVKTLFN
jgi:hypothetical protein